MRSKSLLIVLSGLLYSQLAWSATIGINRIECRQTTEWGEDELSFVVSTASADGSARTHQLPDGGSLIMDPRNRNRIDNLLLWQGWTGPLRTWVIVSLVENDGENPWRVRAAGQLLAGRAAELLRRNFSVEAMKLELTNFGDDDLAGQFLVEFLPGRPPSFHALSDAQVRQTFPWRTQIGLSGDGSRYEIDVGVNP